MSWDRFDLKDEPSYKEGYTYISGERNKYDLIAFDNGVLPSVNSLNLLVPVPSGFISCFVKEIKKQFRPKEESGIHAWRSNVDYSNNSNFNMYWEVVIVCEPMFYELADLFSFDSQERIKTVFDEYDHMQFYVCGKGEHEICI